MFCSYKTFHGEWKSRPGCIPPEISVGCSAVFATLRGWFLSTEFCGHRENRTKISKTSRVKFLAWNYRHLLVNRWPTLWTQASTMGVFIYNYTYNKRNVNEVWF